ncbi:MAG: hypothetical protein ACP5N2_01145 [Candidatus Nanoarchaeia archaeon]
MMNKKYFVFLLLGLVIFTTACSSQKIVDATNDANLGKQVTIKGAMFAAISENITKNENIINLLREERRNAGYLRSYILMDDTGSVIVFSNSLPLKGDLTHINVKVKGILKKDNISGYYIVEN